MGHPIGWGLSLVVLGGMLNGSFAAPMKRLSAWKWENIWLIYAFSGLLILPWAVALVTVPHLGSVFQQSSGAVLAKVALFGFAWGIGGLLFGQGLARVGLALGFALILGITSSFGALLPLIVLHRDQLWLRPGLALMAGTVVMTVGLVFLAVAGMRRERDLAASTERSGFGVGLIICILSGIFSAMLNFAFVFGEEMRQLALHAGASTPMSGNAIWALGVTCGCLPNAAYCIYLLNKNRTWSVYRQKNTGAAYLPGRRPDGSALVQRDHDLRGGRGCDGQAGGNLRLACVHFHCHRCRQFLGIPGRRMERRQPQSAGLLLRGDRHPLPGHWRDQYGERVVRAPDSSCWRVHSMTFAGGRWWRSSPAMNFM